MFKALIVSMVVLHGADAASTCVALDRGFVEANPLFGGHATCGRVVATKAAVIGPAAVLAWKLRASHPKVAALITSVGLTSGGVAVTLNLAALRR